MARLRLVAVIALALAGCGVRDSESRVIASFGPPRDGRFLKAMDLGDGYYWVRHGQAGAYLEILKGGGTTQAPTGLDVVRCATVDYTDDERTLLFLVGCFGSQPRLVVLADKDGDGLINDVIGYRDLPGNIIPEGVAVSLAQGAFYVRCISGATLLRSLDTDDDQVPDSAWTEVVPSTEEIESTHTHVVVRSPTSVILREPPPFYPTDDVTVLVDTDDDGVADVVHRVPTHVADPIPPRLLHAPRVQDLAFPVRGSASSAIELYEVDSDGDAVGTALGMTILNSAGDGVIEVGSAQSLGTLLRLKDLTKGLWSVTWEGVVASYPLLASAAPREFKADTITPIVLSGSGFESAAGYEAGLIQLYGMHVVRGLTVTVVSDDTMEVLLPSITLQQDQRGVDWLLVVSSTTSGHVPMVVSLESAAE